MLLLQKNFDLVFLSESWLNSSVELPSLLGAVNSQYNYVRCDRAYKRGGGVLILLKQSITYNLVFKESAKDAYEILVIDAFLEPHRTPSCSAYATSLLIKAISDFTSYNGHTVVLGDFNMPDLNWKNDFPTDTPSNEMIAMLRSHNLKQFVQNPTRGDSCLDLLFCNSDSLVKKVVVMPPVGSSDHASIEFQINASMSDFSYCEVRDFKAADYGAIGHYLSEVDWIGSFASVESVDEKYEMFIAILHDVINKFVPYRRSKRGRLHLPAYLVRMVSRRNKLWDNAIRERSESCWASYRALSKKLDKAIAKFYSNLERKLVNSGDGSSLY
ncbi:hypothetical protein OSTOST_01133, partial [Ostertagia ostertagi]